ncbi:MAG: AMP-binding protein [Actinomycetales bacterium]|nr:AMP-binding protein [Actinomycetales bacterium]
MSRPLRVVREGAGVLDELRSALSGGDAILVAPATRHPEGLPARVEKPIALVVETSGSTGRPKRVALGADALLASAAASESALGGPGQWMLALPTHYIAGLNVLVRSIAAGAAPVTLPGDRVAPETFVAACDDFAPRVARFVALVPRQLDALLGDPSARDELARFAAVLLGGQAAPAALLERAEDAGVRVVRSYGSSETAGGCVYDGLPIGQTAVRLTARGEVELGGPSLAEGYLGDPGLIAARFSEDADGRWFRTADAGVWREGPDGARLTVTGRLDDVLVSGGLKVATGAIEELLHARSGWEHAVVVAVDDARWGQVPVVVVEGSAPDEAGAIAAVAEVLGVQARPAQVIRVGELPRLASGKPDRAAIAALAREVGGTVDDG